MERDVGFFLAEDFNDKVIDDEMRTSIGLGRDSDSSQRYSQSSMSSSPLPPPSTSTFDDIPADIGTQPAWNPVVLTKPMGMCLSAAAAGSPVSQYIEEEEPSDPALLVVGGTVKVLAEATAQAACEAVDLKWNAARRKRTGSLATLQHKDATFCTLEWVETTEGRVDKTTLKMPLGAVAVAEIVTVSFLEEGSVGLDLTEESPGVVTIAAVKQGTQATQHPALETGLVLVGVGQEVVQGKKIDDVFTVLRDTPAIVTAVLVLNFALPFLAQVIIAHPQRPIEFRFLRPKGAPARIQQPEMSLAPTSPSSESENNEISVLFTVNCDLQLYLCLLCLAYQLMWLDLTPGCGHGGYIRRRGVSGWTCERLRTALRWKLGV